MPHISANTDILENPYFKSFEKENYDNFFFKYAKNIPSSKYIVLQPQSNNLDLEKSIFDPFTFFSAALISKIKKSKINILFDCSTEGWYKKFPYFQRFVDSFESRNIDMKNLFYLTGCAREKDIHAYSNIYHINSLDLLVHEHYSNPISNIKFQFSCLSRKPRYWRSKLIYNLLHDDTFKNKFIFSHPKVTNDNFFMNYTSVEDDIQNFFLDKEFEQITPDQPLVYNMPFKDVISTMPDVYGRVAFDLTMETYQEGDSEYITEKTFKPMLNLTPTIIWGTPGINTQGLARLGFKTYEDWFDLSFDSEQDIEKRMHLLLEEIKRVSKNLDSTNLEDWKNKNKSVLEYNKNLILNLLPTNKKELTRLLNDLDQY